MCDRNGQYWQLWLVAKAQPRSQRSYIFSLVSTNSHISTNGSIKHTNGQEILFMLRQGIIYLVTLWLFYLCDSNNRYFYVFYKVAMGQSFICLDCALMVTSVLLSVMVLLRPPPSPLPWAIPLYYSSLPRSLPVSVSLSLALSLYPRQLGHPGLQKRDSPWWNRGRQLFLQP